MTTRTARGTAQEKTSGTTLTVSSVPKAAYSLLVVGIVYDNSQGDPTIRWGADLPKNTFSLIPGRKETNATAGVSVALFRRKHSEADTRNVVATWPGSIGRRAMFVTELDDVERQDDGAGRSHPGTAAPNTSAPAAAPDSTNANTFHIAAFASIGPAGDTAGTAQNGHSNGQRVGTTGGAATSNVTIQETFEALTATGEIRARMTGATSRDWINTISALESPSKEEDLLTLAEYWSDFQDIVAAVEANHSLNVQLDEGVNTIDNIAAATVTTTPV